MGSDPPTAAGPRAAASAAKQALSGLLADPYAEWGNRTPLYDADGRLLLVFTLAESTRSGRPWADGAWRPPEAPVEIAAEAALDALAGSALSTYDAGLVEALRAAGASELRHAHEMTHVLEPLPEAPVSPLSVVPLSAPELDVRASALGELHLRAYPTGHPDASHDSVESAAGELRAIAAGEILGPLLDVSRIALDGDTVVGACLVVDRDGVPPSGGPWVVELFRDPEASGQGVGRALLVASLEAAAAARLPALSLVVSHANSAARRLYQSLGFTEAGESWTLVLPPAPAS